MIDDASLGTGGMKSEQGSGGEQMGGGVNFAACQETVCKCKGNSNVLGDVVVSMGRGGDSKSISLHRSKN